MKKAIVVLTGKSVASILKEGGSAAWKLDPKKALECSYVVCTRNANADWSEGEEAHRSAFLIGRLSDVIEAPEHRKDEKKPMRYLLAFSEYALVDVPSVWSIRDRNPVKYTTLESLSFDESKLVWHPMPKVSTQTDASAPTATDSEVRPLTLHQAKQGLALALGVSPDDIAITVRS